jgi:hypothetical protein
MNTGPSDDDGAYCTHSCGHRFDSLCHNNAIGAWLPKDASIVPPAVVRVKQ